MAERGRIVGADDAIAELIRAISRRLDLAEPVVRKVLETLSEAALDALAERGSVTLPSLATLAMRDRKARRVRNPRTGSLSIVPPKRDVKAVLVRDFLARAKKRLEAVLVVRPSAEPARSTLRLLSLASYSVLEAADFAEARGVLDVRPFTAILVGPGSAEADGFAFLWLVRTHPTNRLAGVCIVGDPPSGPGEGLRVLPNRWLPSSLPPEAVFERLEAEMARVAEERAFFNQQVHLELPSTSAAVQEALDFLERAMAATPLSEEERFKAVTAFREAIENGVRHGNRHDAKRRVRIEFLADAEKITLSATDEGPGFDFAQRLEAAPEVNPLEVARANLALGKTGGLGMNVMRECVSEVRYLPPGNTLVLTKYFK